jgi:predicted PurR-regulated permease PerM/GAF domain-containing protein
MTSHDQAEVANEGEQPDGDGDRHDGALPLGPSAPPVGVPMTPSPMHLITALAVLVALYVGRDVLIPVALAALLTFLIHPLVARLRRWGLNHAVATIVVLAGITLSLAGTSLYVGGQLVNISQDLPAYQTNVKKKFRTIRQRLSGRGVLDDASRMVEVVEGEIAATTKALDHRGDSASSRAPTPVVITEPTPSAMQGLGQLLEPVIAPLTLVGFVLVLSAFMQLQSHDLRDRVLRVLGGDLHATTDALAEAAHRVSRYLTMQLMVNVGYGIPVALGLFAIGVPGAVLWGVLASILRFVPYLGPIIAAAFPLAMAFAVDPGWNMVFWTLGLVITLELLINNLVEPWLYGASAGLSTLSILLSAVVWTALWGPIGLILATPMTVCLAAAGRHLPQLGIFDIFFGSAPVFDLPTRLYQRLLSGDVEAAIDLASQQVERTSLARFYNDTGIPALRLAADHHLSASKAQHRLRLSVGMSALIADLRQQVPASAPGGPATVLTIGGRWEVDTLAAEMLAHALAAEGVAADHRPASAVAADGIATLDLDGVAVVVLSYFSAAPESYVRFVTRRLRRRYPEVRVLVVAWRTDGSSTTLDAAAAGVDALATSLTEATLRARALLGDQHAPAAAPTAPQDEGERLKALAASGVLASQARALFDRTAERVSNVFNTPMALISFVDAQEETLQGVFGMGGRLDSDAQRRTPRAGGISNQVLSSNEVTVIEDTSRDPRFPEPTTDGLSEARFYAGAPLRFDGQVVGVLSILDRRPRQLSQGERRLLQAMADDAMGQL